MTKLPVNRRALLRIGSAGTTGWLLASTAAAHRGNYPAPTPVDTGAVQGGKVVFPPWRSEADTPTPPPPAPMAPGQRVGFALVGLGRLALEELLPAFAESKMARPVALVSGSPDKMAAVARQYGIAADACHSYDDFEKLRDNPAVQAVYVVLPNGMHREYVESAAAIGKHVLCEKPMATHSSQARSMVAACDRAGVKLMIAYRIQYQPHHLRVRRFVQEKTFGRLVAISATNVQTVHESAAQQWRHKRALSGGGALPDIGLYCLNTARFISGEEPTEVFAQQHSPNGDARFAEVEQTVSFMLRFPSGLIANCFTSYGARDDKHQRLNFETAALDMPNAYSYQGQRLMVGHRAGDLTSQEELVIPAKNQFAEEIDHFADCILRNQRPRTPGEEGLRDHVLMEAIYTSAAEHRLVRV